MTIPSVPLPTPTRGMTQDAYNAAWEAFLGAFPGIVEAINLTAEDLNDLISAAFTTTSSTSLAVGTGTKSLTVQTGLGYSPGQSVVIARTSAPTTRMVGVVTSYNTGSGALVVDVSIAEGSGTHTDWSVSLVPAATADLPGQLTGTDTDDDAAAGKVGEYISAALASVSAVALTTGTSANVVSISLTAGDWDVSGMISFSGTGTTQVTILQGGINTASASLAGLGGTMALATSIFNGTNALAGANPAQVIGPHRISLASTTTVYLVAQATFTVSTAAAFGTIRARRVR